VFRRQWAQTTRRPLKSEKDHTIKLFKFQSSELTK
jgi:hypothetical protein